MDNRPLVNDSFPYLEPEQLQEPAGRISFADVPQKSVAFHRGARIHAMLQSMEPGAPIHIHSEQPMSGTVSVFNGTENTERTTNIISQYQRIYNKKRKEQRRPQVYQAEVSSSFCFRSRSMVSAIARLTKMAVFPVCRLGSCIRIARAAFLSWVQQMTSCPETLSPVA